MSLQEQLAEDMTAAMKARDAATRDALRLLIAACKNKAVELGRGPQGALSDDEVQALLRTERKKRAEAAEGFDAGGNAEAAAGERFEAELIGRYLPAELTDEAIAAIVAEVRAELGDDANMGQMMKATMARVGAQADGKRVQAAVQAALAAG